MVKVLVDVGDIYHKLNRRDGKLDYAMYLSDIRTRFGEIKKAVAYGTQLKNEAKHFIARLESIGFETVYKRPRIFTVNDREIRQSHFGVDITIEAFKDCYDTLVLGVSSIDYIPLIREIRRPDVKVIIFASGVPSVLYKVADEVIEIGPDLFEETPDED